MSPEKRVRPSDGWAKHERRRKAAERKTASPVQPSVEIAPDPRSQTWTHVSAVIQRKFDEQPDLLKLFRRRKPFFRRFFDGRYDISTGRGTGKFDQLLQEYLNDASSPRYNPDLFDRAGPILMTITAETIIPPISTRK